MDRQEERMDQSDRKVQNLGWWVMAVAGKKMVLTSMISSTNFHQPNRNPNRNPNPQHFTVFDSIGAAFNILVMYWFLK
ncbi:hypothetical protein B484DRAFT_242637 [Ochromonadaceae sp. CCMP2298]|nr:hypothetical protein B484DRAFT_242637 [Ochromonadaceae sp. CCMP2298]